MNRTFRHLLVPCLLGLVATTAACELISTVDRSAIGTSGTGGGGGTSTVAATTTGEMATAGTGGSGGAAAGTGGSGGMTSGPGGAGGTGGMTSGSSSASSTSVASSSSGAGCVVAANDCPAAPTCNLAVCVSGACSTTPVAAGTAAGPQTAGDCKQNVCDGAGNLTSIDDNNDHLTDGEACTSDTCAAGAPVHTPVAAGTDCTLEGPLPKHLCGIPGGAGSGTCVECNTGTDCASKVCTGSACMAATCMDGVQNGTETGVDCGGITCAPCVVGCFDGVKNGTESDVDCGGTCAANCVVTQGCSFNSDCASVNCGAAGCQPATTCFNNAQDGTESDKNCGGPACAGCTIGLKCAANSDCLSKLCNTLVVPHVCN
jgi:hypothetical protein